MASRPRPLPVPLRSLSRSQRGAALAYAAAIALFVVGGIYRPNFVLPTNIATMRSFVRACIVKPVPDDDLQTAACWNVVVPATIRANLAAREIDCDDVLTLISTQLVGRKFR